MDWKMIERQLKTPFEPAIIRFRLQGPPRQREGKLMVQVIAYVPAYAVQDRLDQAVGADNWSFHPTPLAFVKGKVSTVKGGMSLFGRATKEEFGENIRLEPDETPVSEALRRCAGLWGIGRYLAQLEMWVEVVSQDPKSWAISSEDLERFRGMLPDPENYLAPVKETMVLEASGEEAAKVVGEVAPPAEAEAEVEVVTPIEMEDEETEQEVAPTEEVAAEEEAGQEEEAEAEEEITASEEEAASAEMEVEEAEEELAEAEEAEEEGWVSEEEEAEEEAAATAGEEPVSQVTVERADPEKVRAIRRLCHDLEEPEPMGLDEMLAPLAEAHLDRLMKQWGEKQRLATSIKPPVSRPAPASTASTGVGNVSDEDWRTYVRLHVRVRGGPPNDDARKYLKPSTVALMIKALEEELNQSDQLPAVEAARAGR